jgi:hypothetical protein
MTKQVRIENADCSTWPVRVTIQHKDPTTGEWVDQPSPVQLNHPTAMTEQYLTSSRRIVIEERGVDPVTGTIDHQQV